MIDDVRRLLSDGVRWQVNNVGQVSAIRRRSGFPSATDV